MVLCLLVVHWFPFLLSGSTLLYDYTIICLSIHLVKDIWIVNSFLNKAAVSIHTEFIE